MTNQPTPQPNQPARTAALRRLSLVLALLVLAALACTATSEPPAPEGSRDVDQSQQMPLCQKNCAQQKGLVNTNVAPNVELEASANIASENQFGGSRTTVRAINGDGTQTVWCVPDEEVQGFRNWLGLGTGSRGNAQEGACQ